MTQTDHRILTALYRGTDRMPGTAADRVRLLRAGLLTVHPKLPFNYVLTDAGWNAWCAYYQEAEER